MSGAVSVQAELVARAFAARSAAHFAHLQTRSYSEHMALEGFYEAILDSVDQFCEVYQGFHGLIKDFPDITPSKEAPLVFLTDFADWLKKNRTACAAGETCLQNIIDEAIAITVRTIYKLRFLK